MKKKYFTFAILILLAFSSLTACYQPIDLTPAEKTEIPWVHCILSPDSTQWLEFRYLSTDGKGIGRGINEAYVKLYELNRQQNDSWSRDLVGTFICMGDGQWRLDAHLKPLQHYYLRIERPGIDTLEASTRMPFFSYIDYPQQIRYRPGLDMIYNHCSGVWYVEDRDDNYTLTVQTEKRLWKGIPADRPSYFPQSLNENYRFDRPRFRLCPQADSVAAMWCYKVGWSEAGQSWFIEDELATDREDRADGFNLTGKTFTESRTQEAMSQFPDVVDKPLHYKYIRFPGQSLQPNEAFAISGDFSGPHYGDAQVGFIISMEDAEKMFAVAAGLPYDNIFTTGHAGYVNFKFVSEEYDHYLKEVAEYELLHDISTDIVGIYRNTNIYTNIRGGTGIFGAEVDNKLYWSCGVWSY